MDISGIALVTGAASGIGRACAIALAKEGAAAVVILDLNGQALEEARADILAASARSEFRCHSKVVDMRHESDVTDAIKDAAKQFARVDYVVNAAGIAFKHIGGAAFADTADWQRVLDVNLNGTFYCLRAAAQIMLKQDVITSSIDGRQLQRGSIVNIASIAGIIGLPTSTAYVTSKHAVVGLTRTASLDYASQGLRINAVCPGFIKTPLIKPGSEIERTSTKMVENSVPISRWGTPEEIANAVLFLAGGRSSLITGSALIADGGFTAQ